MRPARIRSAASQLRGAKVKANIAKGVALADMLVDSVGDLLPGHAREYRFHATRKWRFDLVFVRKITALMRVEIRPCDAVAVEIEGGGWVGGAHSRGKHFDSDLEKYAEAAALGWTVLRVSPAMVRDGRAAAWLKRIAEASHAQG